MIIEFKAKLSEEQSKDDTDRHGNPVVRRWQWASVDQGDGFPARVKFMLWGDQPAYEYGEYEFASSLFQLKNDFVGDQVLAPIDRLPRLQKIIKQKVHVAKTA